MTVEVKIGVSYSARDIVLDSDSTAEEVADRVRAALADGGILTLVDDRGRTVLVPIDKLSYIEIGGSDRARVGFAN